MQKKYKYTYMNNGASSLSDPFFDARPVQIDAKQTVFATALDQLIWLANQFSSFEPSVRFFSGIQYSLDMVIKGFFRCLKQREVKLESHQVGWRKKGTRRIFLLNPIIQQVLSVKFSNCFGRHFVL